MRRERVTKERWWRSSCSCQELQTVGEEMIGNLTAKNTTSGGIGCHFVFYKPDSYMSQFTSAETTHKNKHMLGGELYVFVPENTW
jgi:hypothetical protein